MYGWIIKRFKFKILGALMEPIDIIWDNTSVARFSIDVSGKKSGLSQWTRT